jgi:hypothetical protein
MFACAFFVADLQLEPESNPTTETSATFRPPVTSDVDVPELGSSPNATAPADARAKPAPDISARPSRSALPPTSTPRRFAWAPAEGATGYHVELFRGKSLVFAADTIGPKITVPAKWTFDGSEHQLEPGAYRWYVWPIVSGKRTTRAVVQARLVVRDR